MGDPIRLVDPLAVEQNGARRLEPLTILNDALRVLANRVAVWVALGMSFGLFAYSIVKIDPWRILAASVFTLLVYVPLAWAERKRR